MRFHSQILVALILAIALPSSGIAFAAPSVEDRLKELEQEIAVLKRQIELKKEDDDKVKAEYPVRQRRFQHQKPGRQF